MLTHINFYNLQSTGFLLITTFIVLANADKMVRLYMLSFYSISCTFHEKKIKGYKVLRENRHLGKTTRKILFVDVIDLLHLPILSLGTCPVIIATEL